jgi:hypothetical protein
MKSLMVKDQAGNQKANRSSRRTLLNLIQTILPFSGVLVVVGAVFFLRDLRWQMAIVVVGLLLVEAGVWKVAQNIFPSERKFHALRFEVDEFMRLVRQLNTTALALMETPSPEHQQALENVRSAMQQSVERMAEVAGKTDAQLAEELAHTGAQLEHQDFDSRHAV